MSPTPSAPAPSPPGGPCPGPLVSLLCHSCAGHTAALPRPRAPRLPCSVGAPLGPGCSRRLGGREPPLPAQTGPRSLSAFVSRVLDLGFGVSGACVSGRIRVFWTVVLGASCLDSGPRAPGWPCAGAVCPSELCPSGRRGWEAACAPVDGREKRLPGFPVWLAGCDAQGSLRVPAGGRGQGCL